MPNLADLWGSRATYLRILARVLTNPTQQNLLTVGLLKVCHHILHHILYLHTKSTYKGSEHICDTQRWSSIFAPSRPLHLHTHTHTLPLNMLAWSLGAIWGASMTSPIGHRAVMVPYVLLMDRYTPAAEADIRMSNLLMSEWTTHIFEANRTWHRAFVSHTEQTLVK